MKESIIKKQIDFLKEDFKLYKPDYEQKKISNFLIFKSIIMQRDFRLNFFVRLNFCKIKIISNLAEKIIFYLYGSSIHRDALLNCRVRFCHSRSIVIGRYVKIHNGFAYFFNNITIGKLIPGSPPEKSLMPNFEGNCVFGAGSTLLGQINVGKNFVIGANSFCSIKEIPSNTTVVGFNKLVKGVFFSGKYNPFPSAF